MNPDQLLRALFWTVPFAVTVALSVFLLYLSRKDGDKRKIMFMLCFAFASIGYCNLMLQRYGVPTLWDNNYKWSFVPITAAASIAIMSSLLKLKSFDRPFKCFLFILGISIVLLVFPSSAEVFRIPLLSAFGLLSLPASIYLFIKRRDNSDLMFFLAFSCLLFSWIALDYGLAEEITVLLTLFGMVFTALMFTVTKDRIAGDIASIFVLQDELEKTREDLKQTQKRAREELEASEEKYRTLCEEARVGMLRMDRKGTITYVNRLIKEFGLNKDELIGKNMLKFISKKYRLKTFKQHISVIRGNNVEGETEIITPKGKLIVSYASNPVRQDGKIIGCETVMQDITDKKEMERKLEEYAAQLEKMVEARTIDLKKSEEKLVRYSQHLEARTRQMALLMKSSAEIIYSSDLHHRLRTIAEAIKDQGWRRVAISVRDENMDMKSPDDLVTVGLTDEEREFMWKNRPPGQVSLERFGPEYERFKIGEFYYLPWSDPWVKSRSSPNKVDSHLKPEDMVDWNPQDTLYAALRLADGRIVGRVSVDDPTDGRKPTRESLAPLELFLYQAAVAIENAQLINQLNNAKNQIKEYASKLELKVKERTRDLEEAQSKLLKSERLAAIGELAGMVGHDLRNPLTGITGAAYYLRTKYDSKIDEKGKEMVEIIEKAVAYSNKIISDLLDYSREIKLELTETTPKSMLKEAYSSLEIPRNIRLQDETEDKPRMRADVSRMKRVFINIIKNAFDAMPNDGVLTIRSEKKEKHVSFSFTDTGTGMSEEARGKLWTPLFTTKAKGMGFGLPICKRIVETHGGTISVESTVGKGTTFRINVPIEPRTEETKDVWVNLPETIQLAKEHNVSRARV